MHDGAEQFVFAYGSLAAAEARPASLAGYRRFWGVAMDNRVDIAGYKRYHRLEDGSRPAVHVAFLDIAEDPAGAIDGVLLAVDDVALRALDARERNYDRIDVTAAVTSAPGRVWAYRGSPGGRARLHRALRERNAIVDAGYLDAVLSTFTRLGIEDDVRPGDELALMWLERIDLPC